MSKENWIKVVEGWQKSGLSQAEFCRREKVALSSFQYHKRRLGKDKAERFVEVGSSAAQLIEIVSDNGVVLRVPVDTSCDRISELARCLR